MYNQKAMSSPKKNEKSKGTSTGELIERPPIVVVMGHIDHGKSTLLDYIRKTSIVDKEAGGITQKVGAYEVEVERASGMKRVTFIDTPGHEAFQGIRARGAKTADIAILVVSAEDGVKPQTLQALQTILAEELPYLVAINKIDRPNADIERTKQSLAENEIYVEGYGGNISVVPISAKTGENVDELIETILLMAELEEFKAGTDAQCTGFVLESDRDKKKGNAATLIITSGTMRSGETVVAGLTYSPIRVFENFLGKPIKEATFSAPVRISGWDSVPPVGSTFTVFSTKKEAEAYIDEQKDILSQVKQTNNRNTTGESKPYIPVIIRAQDAGRLDAVIHEISKISHPDIDIKVISSGVGEITEADIKMAIGSSTKAVVVGFATSIDTPARMMAENSATDIRSFEIIYKLSEWLQELLKERIPKKMTDQITGKLKVLKFFSRSKDKQIIGGKVIEGVIKNGGEIKIIRRENDIGRGSIRELQAKKERASEIEEGRECGLMVESKFEIAPGDILEAFETIEI